jgi:hypothetical protein
VGRPLGTSGSAHRLPPPTLFAKNANQGGALEILKITIGENARHERPGQPPPLVLVARCFSAAVNAVELVKGFTGASHLAVSRCGCRNPLRPYLPCR